MTLPVRAVTDSLRGIDTRHSPVRVICAVSGGADSVALLRALWYVRQSGGIDLSALHVQHGLRGEASRQDEAYVRSLCDEWQIPLRVMEAGLNGTMDTPGMETEARNRRRSLFAEAMREADVLMTAHHRDDQAETVLMHLMRGSGLEGLCGMKPRREFAGGLHIRPFLSLSRAQLEDFLRQEGISWRNDESNGELCTPRNVLRLQLIPQLEALFPQASAHMAAAAEHLSSDAELLNGLALDLYCRALIRGNGLFALRRSVLRDAPEALVRRVLRRWVQDGLAEAGIVPDEKSLSSEETLRITGLACAEAGTCENLPFGMKAEAGKRLLWLSRQDGSPVSPLLPVPAQTLAEAAFPGMSFEGHAAFEIPRSACSAVFPREILAEKPVLRLPSPGDRLRPLGAPGHKELRRYFTDIGLDQPLRRVWPVVAAGNTVLWIPMLCTAEELRLTHVPEGALEWAVSDGYLTTIQAEKEI